MGETPLIGRWHTFREKVRVEWGVWRRANPVFTTGEKWRTGLSVLLGVGYVALMAATLITPPPATLPEGADTHGVSPASGFPSFVWIVAALLTAALVRPLIRGQSQRHWYIFRRIRPLIIVQNLGVIAATIGLAYGLSSLFPILDRSWLYLIPGADGATNIGVMPARLPYVGVLYVALFAVNIPMFAAAEERQYRRGTKNWRNGVYRSLRFGLAHWIMGIPLYAALALTLPGLWYTYIYFRDGEEGATTHHATYNLIVCFLLFIVALLSGAGKF